MTIRSILSTALEIFSFGWILKYFFTSVEENQFHSDLLIESLNIDILEILFESRFSIYYSVWIVKVPNLMIKKGYLDNFTMQI